jgi:hypothetical protein
VEDLLEIWLKYCELSESDVHLHEFDLTVVVVVVHEFELVVVVVVHEFDLVVVVVVHEFDLVVVIMTFW